MKQSLGLKNEDGSLRPETWEDLQAGVRILQAHVRALGEYYPGRKALLDKLLFAYATRQHLLTYGPHGTAKTGLIEMALLSIDDAKVWSCDFSRTMTESHVFGDFNVKRAQETGQLWHQTEESLLEADFANLGEFLDANTALLRSLLRVINERGFKRGPQKLSVPLRTAIANTNTNPVEAAAKNADLGAVVDRFLFWEPANYLTETVDRLRILKIRAGLLVPPPVPRLSRSGIDLIADVVLKLHLVAEERILIAYEEIARMFGQKRNRPVSDRRFAAGIDIMEASAVLRNAPGGQVGWEDILATGLILVDNPTDRSLFDEIAKNVIEAQQTRGARDLVEEELTHLQQIVASVPSVQPDDIKVLPLGDVVKIRREALQVIRTLQGQVAPTTLQAQEEKRKQIDRLRVLSDLAQETIDTGNGVIPE